MTHASITNPGGFLAAGIKAGLKKSGRHDLGLLFCPEGASLGAVYTQNKAAAAPVLWDRERSGKVKALVVNSGCANACTGQRGKKDTASMASMAAEALGIRPEEVLVCSTGVIGQFLPMDLIEKGIFQASKELGPEGGQDFALSMQTTDTFQKHCSASIELDGAPVLLCGAAKGAGMIHPNMATLLCFITTDASIAPALLQRAVKAAADRSFNMVVVDGDTSTNDSMIVLASGRGREMASEEDPAYPVFFEALLAVSTGLAQQIARDGEGATKFLEITVSGAQSFKDAKKAALSLAKSPLVKTAFYGEDPNWGRIICAAGYSGADFNPEEAALWIGGVPIMEGGMGLEANREELETVMKQRDIAVRLSLGAGPGQATAWTCDFSPEYVEFNGKYRT